MVQRASVNYQLIVSSILLKEFSKTLHKPRFTRFDLTDDRIIAICLQVRASAEEVVEDLVNVPTFSPDPEDTHVLALARTAHVHYLVTGDKALLALETYRGTQIVTPRTFFDILNTHPRHRAA